MLNQETKEKLKHAVLGLAFDATEDLQLCVSYDKELKSYLAWYWRPELQRSKISKNFYSVEEAKMWAEEYRITQLFEKLRFGDPDTQAYVREVIVDHFRGKPVGQGIEELLNRENRH